MDLFAEIAKPDLSDDPVSDDYLHLAAPSYEELWRVQKTTLFQLRGVDARKLSGDTTAPSGPFRARPTPTSSSSPCLDPRAAQGR